MTRDEVIASAATAMFGKPLVTNVYRSVIVEAMIAGALQDWQWCSADYMSYDFIHADGTRLEVKHSAMRQTWETKGTPKPSWDIAARTGIWENGADWVERVGRNDDIYVLGLHDVMDETADHRELWPGAFSFNLTPESASNSMNKATTSAGPISQYPTVPAASSVYAGYTSIQGVSVTWHSAYQLAGKWALRDD